MRFKKTFTIVCSLLAIFAVERFCRYQTAGFRLDKLHSDFVFQPKYPNNENPSFGKLLDQRFTFLGSGVQCYAFLGQDEQTVLKVFKHYHNFPIKGILKTFPLPASLENWRTALAERRTKRLNSIFTSCEIAEHEFKNETGMLGTHLQPTHSLNRTITLVDKLGIEHQINADQTAFILQKRVEMLPEKIDLLMKAGARQEMEQCLSSLIKLIAARCEKEISNHDLRFDRNIGFAGTEAIEIDVGSYKKIKSVKKPKHKYREMRKELFKMQRWAANRTPEFSDYVAHEIQTILEHN
jgi:hypothetical protein